MQERKSILDDYFDEKQAMKELGVDDGFFKWLIYVKRLNLYLLNKENSEQPETRLFAKTDVEELKKSFCSIIGQQKTCYFLCKKNQ